MRYNLEFRKLTFYGLNGPSLSENWNESLGKRFLVTLKTSSLILILRKIATFQWLKIALHGPSRQRCYDRYTLSILFNVDHMPYSSIQSITSSSNHRLMSTFEFS